MGELVLEPLALGEVLEHEPHLEQGPVFVTDGIDVRPEPARLRLGRRLTEQQRRGQLATVPALFKIGGEPQGVLGGVHK